MSIHLLISSLWQKYREKKKFQENKENLILIEYDIPVISLIFAAVFSSIPEQVVKELRRVNPVPSLFINQLALT